MVRPRLLIEEWLPIANLGAESLRERTISLAGNVLPPTTFLHVWWARRPLVASRAAVLASLLPADANRDKFLHILGIHGDPTATKRSMIAAGKNIDPITGKRQNLGPNPYGYPRAFKYSPSEDELHWVKEQAKKLGLDPPSVLDPTAGGGSIPLEAKRLGLEVFANDLNPVAWLVLKATIEFPSKLGLPLLRRYQELSNQFMELAAARLKGIFPAEPPGVAINGFLWSRTIVCPYCGGLVPLSPNWRLDNKGTGVRLVPHVENPQNRHCSFEIVTNTKDQSSNTVKNGDGLCPYPDCGRVIDGDDYVKPQAQAGQMGHQLYAVIYKQRVKVGTTKSGKDKFKTIRGFRSPRPEDDTSFQVNEALTSKRPEWLGKDVLPEEDILPGYETSIRWPLERYGLCRWTDFFSPRQLFTHCTSVEVFHQLVDELRDSNQGEITELDLAALSYLAIVLDKLLDWNSTSSTWEVSKQAMAHTFAQHSFSFKTSYCEMPPAICGNGFGWAIEAINKALEELISFGGDSRGNEPLFATKATSGSTQVSLGSGDSLALTTASVDCVVVDPPYYNNVTYSELSDFFYVWLKRTAGLLFPDQFAAYLTDKDHEAIANPFRFRGQKKALKLAGRDYQERMASIFTECRRVIRPHGVMTVMFTHKASGAWDALATGLVKAGWVITASWPINTEAESSLHIQAKSAAKSTIFLVCRPRETSLEDVEVVYWEEVEPRVKEAVRLRVAEFQEAGIGGVDLYLASFGPALQVFSENWPLKRGRPIQKPRELALFPDEEFDPYAVQPEDALDAARGEVKRWRMEQLATVKRKHHLDPLTEFFVLAWDAFKAPRFPVDEALKLARVVGLDFDQQVKNQVCEVKSSDVILWDSKTRKSKGKLGPMGDTCMLNTLHQAAAIVRDQNTGAAEKAIEDNGLLEDATLLTALEALLNVLPAVANPEKAPKLDANLSGATSDFEALEKLRKLAFAEQVPEPARQLLLPIDESAVNDETGEE